jgi:hypothetical protein
MDVPGTPGRTGLGALRSAPVPGQVGVAPAASGAAASIAPAPAAAATAKRAADHVARKEAKAKAKAARSSSLTSKASRRCLLTRGAALFGLGQTSDTDYPTVLLGTSSASRWWPG